MVTVEAWYQSLPPFTKFWFTASALCGVTSLVGIPLSYYLYWNFDLIFSGQIWRVLTGFVVFGPLGINWLMSMYLLCQYVRELETTVYSGRRGAAELVFVALFGVLCINVLMCCGFHVMPATCLMSMFIYIWSRVLPHAPILVYGFTFERWHMPLIIIGISVLLSNGPPFDPIFGVAIGHSWKMLTEILPRVYHKTFVTCPQVLYDFVDKYWPRLLGEPIAQPAAAQRPAWQRGAGYRLGDGQ